MCCTKKTNYNGMYNNFVGMSPKQFKRKFYVQLDYTNSDKKIIKFEISVCEIQKLIEIFKNK